MKRKLTKRERDSINAAKQHAKKKPVSLAQPTDWDLGPRRLADLGETRELVAAFRDYLRRNPIRWKRVILQPESTVPAFMAERLQKEEDEMREKQALRDAAVRFVAESGRDRRLVEALIEWDEQKQREVPNPNGVKRARRIDLVEYYQRRGEIEFRQMAAGKALLAAWEATQRSPEAIKKVQVDSTPDHGAIAAMQVDRISRFHAVRKLIPSDDWEVLECICIRNVSVAHAGYRGRRHDEGLRHMAEALARLADRLGL